MRKQCQQTRRHLRRRLILERPHTFSGAYAPGDHCVRQSVEICDAGQGVGHGSAAPHSLNSCTNCGKQGKAKEETPMRFAPVCHRNFSCSRQPFANAIASLLQTGTRGSGLFRGTTSSHRLRCDAARPLFADRRQQRRGPNGSTTQRQSPLRIHE